MLKNVICDMGNVLMYWDPKALARAASSDPADAAVFEKELFTGPEWPLNDVGTYDENELFASVAKRIPERLRDRYDWLIDNWHDYMQPIPGACDFLKYAKAKGYKVFMLSNASERFPQCVSHYDFYKLLDDVIVSWHVKASKPDEKIYRIALERFGIKAEESVFIDDIPVNVEAAEKLGIHGYVFDGDYEKLERYIDTLGA